MKCAIIGFGCAGYHGARELRRLCPEAEIDVYEQAVRGGANPMLTTYYAGARIGFEQMFPFGKMEDICRTWRLNLISAPVERVETAGRAVRLADGSRRCYDKLLIATGASALLPAFLRVEGKEVFLMRTAAEARQLKEYLNEHPVASAAVIGASMVGIKVAEVLHARGIDTTLMDAADRIFPLAAYPSTAEQITRALEERGLHLRMGVRVSGVDPRGVVFQDGTAQPADLVCLCIGTRANVELAANTQVVAGERIRVNRGIVVDTHMETSVPGVYAAGDCCEGVNLQTGETMIIGLWANAAAQGECAGSNMAGVPAEHYGSFPHNITRFFGLVFVGLGDPSLPGEQRRFQRDGMEVTVVKRDGVLQSMNIWGSCLVSGVLKSLLARQLNRPPSGLSPVQRGLLARAGLPRDLIDFIGGDPA